MDKLRNFSEFRFADFSNGRGILKLSDRKSWNFGIQVFQFRSGSRESESKNTVIKMMVAVKIIVMM